ncbi:MAG: 2-hydroxyacid dehydrogenase [Marmoricola sp.]
MSDPLVWLPFDPAELGDPPAGLRYDVVRPERGQGADTAGEVRFYVPAYQAGRLPADLLTPMTSLEVVQTLTAGVDHVRPLVPPGVTLCNGRGIHDTSTAELAVTLALASLRAVPRHVRAQDERRWAPHWGDSLADKHVLIVGYGQIGAAIEERLTPFECTVTRVARSGRGGVHGVGELPDLLPAADVVILVMPGTRETLRLFDAAMLARMRDGALLVNVARGTVVDTDALLAELRSGRLRAALDVTDPEPLPEGHPLWSAPGVLITPHVGGTSSAMWPRAYRLVREQLQRYAAGEPLANVVSGDY